MTKDIEARLRAPAYWMCGSSKGHEGESTLPLKAADALQRYWEALEKIERMYGNPDINHVVFRVAAKMIAHKALASG